MTDTDPGPLGVAAEGFGAVEQVSEIVAELAGAVARDARVVLVVGEGFDRRPWAARVRSAVQPLAPWVEVHEGMTTPESVARLVGIFRAARANVAIAVGGGTVLDATKAAACLAGGDGIDSGAVVDACLGRVSRPPSTVPVVAIPTTVGTGAEATPFATVWDHRGGRKLSLAGPDVRPAAAVLDPNLIQGLGRNHLASGVLDTFCQGAEAAWSIRATEESISWGMAAVALVATVIDRVHSGQLTGVDRLTLQRAGHCSGRAITIAQTSSCHALSYPLTLRLGLPHGHACGVTLGRMLRYNCAVTAADCLDPRGPRHVRHIIDGLGQRIGGDPRTAAARVEGFLAGCGLARYDDLSVDHRAVATDALSYPRCYDNPRRLSEASLNLLLATPVEMEEPCG